ncbi:hypothetical protein DPEC_G00238000 [Dallia pectoralis]|uniref:Uncharacterized protein n=1 Tax=Dallia pectoralis TaxID=75939 RepID=A0ACC2FZ72_DALPE|nr:hypothetical protein DPEC_G00238000 [Dallia pectoralis]
MQVCRWRGKKQAEMARHLHHDTRQWASRFTQRTHSHSTYEHSWLYMWLYRPEDCKALLSSHSRFPSISSSSLVLARLNGSCRTAATVCPQSVILWCRPSWLGISNHSAHD